MSQILGACDAQIDGTVLDPGLEHQNKRRKLTDLESGNEIDRPQNDTNVEEEESTSTGTNDKGAAAAHIATTTTSSEDRVIRDGLSLPRDSMLLNDLTFTYTPEEISSDMLIRANLASLPLTLQANDSLPIRIQFLINSIPLLDNVATQILRKVGVGPYEETLAIITNEEPTPERLVFNDLVELFEQVKRIYSEEDPFLNFQHILQDTSSFNDITMNHLKDLEGPIDSALRKANMATFLLSTLGSIEVGFFFLNESFLDVFCPTINNGWFNHSNFFDGSNHSNNIISGKLLKAQAGLYLELKTQAYISALEAGNRSKEDILDDIFPSNLEEILSERRKSDKLTPAELDFISRCKSRRETLLNLSDQASDELSENYDWLIFLKELFSYVSKNIGVLIWGKKGRGSLLKSLSKDDPLEFHPYGSLTKEQLQEKLRQQQIKERELKERERLELERAAHPAPKMTRKQKVAAAAATTGSASASSSKASAQQAVQTSGPSRIRNILRRPWSSEEENTLVEALKDCGPHWSKILEVHGAGGSKSEALRTRTQVQLKDKARNWKMAYLKSGNPVPDYLKEVTGGLEREDKAGKSRKKQRKALQNKKERLLLEQKQEQNETIKEKEDSETVDKPEAVIEESSDKLTKKKPDQEEQSDVQKEQQQNELATELTEKLQKAETGVGDSTQG